MPVTESDGVTFCFCYDERYLRHSSEKRSQICWSFYRGGKDSPPLECLARFSVAVIECGNGIRLIRGNTGTFSLLCYSH